jgi:hypothetical protein
MGQKGQNSGDTQDDGLEKPTSGEIVSGEKNKRDKGSRVLTSAELHTDSRSGWRSRVCASAAP